MATPRAGDLLYCAHCLKRVSCVSLKLLFALEVIQSCYSKHFGHLKNLIRQSSRKPTRHCEI